MLLWSAFCRGISGCKRPSSTASTRALSSSSLTPPNSNQLTFVLRYLLSARSFFPNTPTHPETRLRLHRTRRQEKRFEGGGEPRQSTGPGSLPGQLHHLPSPVFTSPPKPTLQRNSGRCGQIARRCGNPPPTMCPRAASAAPLTPRSAGGSAPQQVTPPRPAAGCGHPAREGVWLARRDPVRLTCEAEATPGPPPPRDRERPAVRPPSRAAHRGRRHCPRLPARPPASQPHRPV